MYLKIKVFIHQFRYRREEMMTFEEETSKRLRKLKKHQKLIVQTNNAIKGIYGSILVGYAGGLHVCVHVHVWMHMRACTKSSLYKDKQWR